MKKNDYSLKIMYTCVAMYDYQQNGITMPVEWAWLTILGTTIPVE